MSEKKKILERVISWHQPAGGGHGIELSCSCGKDFSAAHQIESVLAGWEAKSDDNGCRY